jgi:hypothetical protein
MRLWNFAAETREALPALPQHTYFTLASRWMSRLRLTRRSYRPPLAPFLYVSKVLGLPPVR